MVKLPIHLFVHVPQGKCTGEIVFEDPTAWLSDPAATEEKIRKYLDFCNRWFDRTGLATACFEMTDGDDLTNPGAFLHQLLEFFAENNDTSGAFGDASVAGRVRYLDEEEMEEAAPQLRRLRKDLAR